MIAVRGSCRCRALGVLFTTAEPSALEVRACQCSFCRAHDARTVTDPAGRARILVRASEALERHRFGTRTSDFLVCAQCGIYVAALVESEGRTFATVNVSVLGSERFAAHTTPVDYGAEGAEERLARRLSRWTPADLVTCERERADAAAGAALIDAYLAELAGLLGGFDPARSVSADPAEMAPPGGTFLVMREAGTPIACGGLKTHAPGVGEIKRMFTAPGARGRGLARDLLFELEDAARDLGMERLVLDTAAPLAAAASLYAAAGYLEVPPFNDNPYAARWFAKPIAVRA